jgi:hypothetical protein
MLQRGIKIRPPSHNSVYHTAAKIVKVENMNNKLPPPQVVNQRSSSLLMNQAV